VDFDDLFIPQFCLASFWLPRHTCGSFAAHQLKITAAECQNSCVVSGESWIKISAQRYVILTWVFWLSFSPLGEMYLKRSRMQAFISFTIHHSQSFCPAHVAKLWLVSYMRLFWTLCSSTPVEENVIKPHFYEYTVRCMEVGRAIAQAVSRRLPIAAARVQTGSGHVGFCDGQK
jgi:hypothetical protein